VIVRWKATNPEQLTLSASIDYSRDGGRSWRTIFIGPNTGRAALASFYLIAARHARVRVRVNDGFNESDAVSGRFTALGAPPQVTIQTVLASGTRVAGDARLQLDGQAFDQRLRALSGRSLKWYDGPFVLGTGSALSAGPLPAGANHIRLVASDPGGRSATATLTAIVSPVKLPFLKLRIPQHASPGARHLTFRAAASVPATLTIDRHHFTLGKRAKKFSLPIGRGRRRLLLQITVAAGGINVPFAVNVTR
jgi:hypothetical protein